MSKLTAPDWKTFTVAELIEHKFTGPSPTCEERPIASSEEWGLLKTTAITWSGWNENAHKVPPRRYWGNQSIEVKMGDVLITKAGPRHRVGVVVHVASTRPRLMVSGKMVGLRPNKSKVVPSILAGLLSTQSVQDYLNSRTTGMAESQTNFADDVLLRTELSVPPIPEQRRIAKILDALDDWIRATEQIIAKLRKVRGALVSTLLHVGGDGNWGATWPLLPLGKLVSGIDAGKSPDCPDEPAPPDQWGVLKVSAVGSVHFRPVENKVIPPGTPIDPRSMVRSGDVLVTRANTPELVGMACLVDQSFDSRLVLCDKTWRINVSDRLDRPFLVEVLRAFPSRSYIQSVATGTSGSMKNFSQRSLLDMLVPVPDLAEQIQISDRIAALTARIDAEMAAVAKLKELKVGLIADLLTGRVRVPLETAP
jgi:type I restriction enzyme, S subunit